MPWTEINGVRTFVAADATTTEAGGAPAGPPAGGGKSWVARHKVATAVLAAVAVIGGVTAFSGGSGDDTTASQTPSASQGAPLTAREKADKAVDAVDNARVTQYGKQLYIRFPIRESLTDGSTRAVVAMDTFKLLEALKKHDVPFDVVTINGTADMVDAYGAEKPDMRVFNVDVTHETVNRIEYKNIATTELDVLERFAETDRSGAAEMWLHPAFGWKS